MNVDPRDELTGLFRAWHGNRFAPERAAPWLASPPPDTVFVELDLRGFKAVNDEHGFAVGERVLAEVGRRITEVAGDWPAYRIGGDEFLVALRVPDDGAIRDYADKLRARLQQPHEGMGLRVLAAAGRAAPGDTPQSLFARTDRAMEAVTQNQSSELLIAPPKSDEATWHERPTG